MIGRVTDQTMMLHGLKDVNTRDVLKLHGFNKDKPGLREFEFNYLVDDIHTFSDETFIVVNHTSKVMWLSYYDKTINVPFTYANCFKFYEEDGEKYCIAYVSGYARPWYYNGGSSYWYMMYSSTGVINILFRKYRLTYDAGNPKFTLIESTTINDIDAHMKVDRYITNETGINYNKLPYTFEFNPDTNQVLFLDWGLGYSHKWGDNDDATTCDLFLQDLNTKTLRDYKSLLYTEYDTSTGRIISRSKTIRNVMLFWYNYRNGSSYKDDFSRVVSYEIKDNKITQSDAQITQVDFGISNSGQDSYMSIQGACFYKLDESHVALGEFYARWYGVDDTSASLCYTGWSCPNIGQRTSIITLQDEYDILLNDENNIIATADKQHNMTFPGYTLKELVISDLVYDSSTPTNANFYIYLGTIPFLTIQYNSISINYRMGYSTPAYSTITSGLSPRTSRLTITLKIVSSTSMRLDIRSVNKTSGVVNTYTQNLTLTAQNLSILSQYVEFRKFNIDGYSYTYDVSQEYTDDSKVYEVKRFPVGNMPQAFTCNTVANLPVGYKQAYKYNKRLSNDNINYQLLMSSKKQENPQTLYTHSIYTLQDYEMDVEINRQQYDGFDWTRIIFKDEQGNTVPHFMEPRQPNGTVIFVLKVNLKAGWNVFTFEQGSVLTNQLSKGTVVFSKFFNLTAGKPSGWTIPSGYEFNSTNGLIKGSTNQYTEEFINTGIYPQIGMRYEIGFGNYLDDRGNNGTYAGYYQFGQFDRNFWRQSVLTQNMDGVRGQTTYGNSDNRHGPRHATVDMRTNTVSSGRIAGHRAGSQWRYEYCDTISGFEMGKDRVLAYSYLQTGRSSRFVAYTGWGNNVIGPYIPSTENGYGITRTPDLTKPIKLLSLWYNSTNTNRPYNEILYIRERKAWQGETTTAGYKNTYLIKAGSKYYLDVPF